MRPFEEGVERSRRPLGAWSAEAVLRTWHEQTRNTGGCRWERRVGEAEEFRVLCRDANAIVRGRGACLRYGVEG
jgi:hypothetical protein